MITKRDLRKNKYFYFVSTKEERKDEVTETSIKNIKFNYSMPLSKLFANVDEAKFAALNGIQLKRKKIKFPSFKELAKGYRLVFTYGKKKYVMFVNENKIFICISTDEFSDSIEFFSEIIFEDDFNKKNYKRAIEGCKKIYKEGYRL